MVWWMWKRESEGEAKGIEMDFCEQRVFLWAVMMLKGNER